MVANNWCILFHFRESICIIQGKDYNEPYQSNTEGGQDKDQDEDLPMPTYDNLQQIADEIQAATPDITRKRRVCQIIS